MICGLDTRGKMQYYFHYQVLTINKLSGLLFMLIRLKFCTLGRLNSTPISLNIMQVSPKNTVFTTKTASSSTTKLAIRPQVLVVCIFIGGNLMSFKRELANQNTDGPLEKWWGFGTFSACSVFIFSQPLSLQDFIFGSKSPAHLFFCGVGGGSWNWRRNILLYCNLNLDTHHNLNAWNRLQVQPNNF